MSALRTTARTRTAASASTASPARWPIRSLTSLKSSRSKTTRASLRAVAVGPRDLARERLVEVAPVVEARQRVEVGELARLAEAARVLDRRAGADGELLEPGELLVREPPARSRGVKTHEASRAARPRPRAGRASPPWRSVPPASVWVASAVPVDELDEPGPRVRPARPASACRAASSSGKPDGRDDAGAALGAAVDPDDRRVARPGPRPPPRASGRAPRRGRSVPEISPRKRVRRPCSSASATAPAEARRARASLEAPLDVGDPGSGAAEQHEAGTAMSSSRSRAQIRRCSAPQGG